MSGAGKSLWAHPWSEFAFFAVAAFAPWLLLEVQERLRWGGHEGWLWPLFPLATFPVLAAAALLVLRPGRPARETAHIEGLVLPGRDPARLARWGFAAFAGIAVTAFAVGGFFRDLHFNPLCSFQADQIPFVDMALRDFWRDSRFPYHRFEVAHWYENSVYPPFLLLQFTLPWWFGVDPRIWSAACLAALCVCLFLHAGVSAAASSSLQARIGLLLPVSIPFAVFWLPQFRDATFQVQTCGVWAMCAMLALAIRTRSWATAGVLLALCILSRAWFLLAVPPMLVHSFAAGKRMGWGVARFWGAFAVTGAFFGLPFLLFDPGAFLHNTLGSHSILQAHRIAANPDIVQGFGATGLLHKLRIADAALPVALFMQALLVVAAVLRVRSERDVVRAMAVNLMAFAAFAPIPFAYLFVPPLVLLAFAGPASTMNERNALEALPRRMVGVLRGGLAAVFAGVLFLLIGAGMFARPKTVPATNAPLESQVRLFHGFERPGWWPATFDEGHLVTGRHAYLSFTVAYPRLRTLYIETSVANAGEEPVLLDVVLNGEAVGTIETGAERSYARIAVPRKNLRYGGNELGLHVGSRYGEPPPYEPAAVGLRIHDVRASD